MCQSDCEGICRRKTPARTEFEHERLQLIDTARAESSVAWQMAEGSADVGSDGCVDLRMGARVRSTDERAACGGTARAGCGTGGN